MRTHMQWSVAVASIFLVAGCSPSSPPPPDTTAVEGLTAHAQAPADSQPASTDSKADSSATSKAATDDSKTVAEKSDDKSKPRDEIVQGLKDEQLVRAYEEAKKNAAENPKDPNAQTTFINTLQFIGQHQMQNGDSEKAYKTFAAAGDVALKYAETNPELPSEQHIVLGTAMYNGACALSHANDAKGALASLDKAFEWGMNDWNLLENDDDLKLVRALPEFPQHLEQWKKAARERVLQKVKSELAAATSFPFDFKLTDVDDKPIALADFQGKVAIVDIWGTWCPPCRAEIPSFIKLQKEYGDKGLQIVGLNQEDGTPEEVKKKIKDFIEEQSMNYPCAVINEDTLKQVPDFEGFPTTLFIDRSGKVRLKVVGLHPYEFLEAVVTTLLEEPAAEKKPAA